METRFGGVFRVILPDGIQQPKVNPVKELITYTYSEAGFSVPVVFESIKLSAEFAIQKDEAQVLREKVNALFAVPNLDSDDGEDEEHEEMWKLLKPMTVEFFAQFWKRVEGEDFDYSGCELDGEKMEKQNK